MHTYDVRYFQAMATVIPTLLIAVFFTARFIPRPKDRLDGPRFWIVFTIGVISVGIVLVFVVLGERAALAALLSQDHFERRAATARRGFNAALSVLIVFVYTSTVARPLITLRERRLRHKTSGDLLSIAIILLVFSTIPVVIVLLNFSV